MRSRNRIALVGAVLSIAASAAGCGGGRAAAGADASPPDRVEGYVGVSLVRFDGEAYLAATALMFQESFADPWNDVPLGSCVEGSAGLDDFAGLTGLQAGDALSLAGPGGEMTLGAIAPGIYYGEGPSALFAAGAGYTLTGSGGADVDAFQTALTAPARELVLTDAPAALSPAADLRIAWEPGASTESVRVSLAQKNGTGAPAAAVVCRFADDGSGTIPKDLLAAFEAGGAPAELEVYGAAIAVTQIPDVGTVRTVFATGEFLLLEVE